MDFQLSAEQRRWRETARAFARERLAPGYRQRERQGFVEPEIRRELGELGLIAPELPVELGGQGVKRLTSGVIAEEIAAGDFSVSYLLTVGSLVGQMIAANASKELAAYWIPQICSGQAIVGIGLSEPHAGSDAGMPRLRAHRDGDGWVIHGLKSLSYCLQAEAAIVFARTSDSQERGRDISAFLVPLDLPGVSRESYPDMGSKAVQRGAAHFDGVRIPAALQLGAEGAGFTQVMHGFDFSRVLIALQCIGVAQVTLEETWDYVTQRVAFDQPLSKNQGVVFPLAECETLLTAARLLCYETLWRRDTGAGHTSQAAMCKWWAPKMAFDVIQQCLLLHGQAGYRTELPIEQRLRDVLGLQIGDGTAQIMKLIIARERIGKALAP